MITLYTIGFTKKSAEQFFELLKQYTEVYTGLLKSRDIIKKYGVTSFDGACFLCSEETPELCHRRLLVEYMKEHSLEEVVIKHLV